MTEAEHSRCQLCDLRNGELIIYIKYYYNLQQRDFTRNTVY